jgi:ligand-binding sensor domain-containing protein
MSGRLGMFFIVLFVTISLNAQKPGDRVNSIISDEYGCQWFGTDNGLLRKCGEVWTAYSAGSGSPLIVNDIKSVTSPSGSMLWIASMNGMIRLSYSGSSVTSETKFSSATTTFLTDTIRKIATDKYSSVFFATPSGIGILANATWKFLSELTDIIDNKITSAMASGDTIFFGTTGEGVGRLVRKVDGYSGASSLVAPWSGLAGDNITCVFVDSKGYRWYGTDKGLSNHIKPEAKEGWDQTFTDKLPDKYVSSIAEDNSGNIWVGTHGGLVRFSNGWQTVTKWTVADGLPSSFINSICIDKGGSVWIGTDMGASHFNGSRFENFRTSGFARDFVDLSKLAK